MARHRAPPIAADQMATRPDGVASSGALVKNEEPDDVTSGEVVEGEEDDDPVVRTIDVFLSPSLSDTIHLLQFPIHPAAANNRQRQHGRGRDRSSANVPSEARFRPKHHMLELDYPIPSEARGGQRQLSDKMCLSQRTFTSDSIAPVTHMALAKLNKSGERLNVVPLTRSVLQMRPSFRHLHDEDDDDAGAPSGLDEGAAGGRTARQRPVMFQKKETERSIAARKNSYAYKRASEEGEEWIELDVHGGWKWSAEKKDAMLKVKCQARENVLKLARNPKSTDVDGGYVRSLNYLDSVAQVARTGGDAQFVENLSEWAPSTIDAAANDGNADNDDADEIEVDGEAVTAPAPVPAVGATERAAAELASKLAILLQTGNGAMVPYRVLRSRFRPDKVPDEVLTLALSSCAVLVRGNFSLKSELAKFLSLSGVGSGEGRKRRLRELRDLILLLLNMHGMVQRERLERAYSAMAGRGVGGGYDAITADVIAFVLRTVAKKSDDCWVAKVEDDEEFAAVFPEVAACHGVYWMKKKDMLIDLIELYENADVEEEIPDASC